MMASSAESHYRTGQRQCGMVSVIVLMVLVSIVILVAIMTLRIADTGVDDALNQSSDVAALFLAESGLEFATQQLSSGADSCGAMAATSQSFGRGSFIISASATTDYDGVTMLPAGECRVQVSGKVSNSDVTRTVQGIIHYSGSPSGVMLDSKSSLARNYDDNFTFPVTVAAAGFNRLLVVGVVLRNNVGQTVASVSYAGVPLKQLTTTNYGNEVEVELWQLAAPVTGTNNVQVVLNGAKTGVVAGAISLTGVDQTTPVEATATPVSGSSNSPSLNISTLTNNAWVIDVLGFLQSSPIPAAGASQTEAWNVATGGTPSFRVRGASSTLGPYTPAGSVTMNWSLSSSRHWVLAAVAVRPAASSGIGVLSWREIVY